MKVVEPLAEECLSAKEDSMDFSCPQKWDHLLCWPQTKANLTVAIPCNASLSFVDIITTSRPSLSPNQIPGEFLVSMIYLYQLFVFILL